MSLKKLRTRLRQPVVDHEELGQLLFEDQELPAVGRDVVARLGHSPRQIIVVHEVGTGDDVERGRD